VFWKHLCRRRLEQGKRVTEKAALTRSGKKSCPALFSLLASSQHFPLSAETSMSRPPLLTLNSAQRDLKSRIQEEVSELLEKVREEKGHVSKLDEWGTEFLGLARINTHTYTNVNNVRAICSKLRELTDNYEDFVGCWFFLDHRKILITCTS
jgi:hypothetical protein